MARSKQATAGRDRLARGIEVDPVRVDVVVARAPEEAFRLFTGGMGTWWPSLTHSIGEDKVQSVVFEERPGGRIFERWADGTECDWGRVQVWEPPGRVVFEWNASLEERPMTEVEVRFTSEGSGTRVSLEHRHWERLGDLGTHLRSGYGSDTGWTKVLGSYEAAAM